MKHKASDSRLKAWFTSFVEPHPSIQDVALRYKSRLLTIILIAMIGIFLALDTVNIITIPGYRVPWYGYVFLLTALGLNKTGWYLASSSLTLVMFPLVIFSMIGSGRVADIDQTLSLLVISIILGGILLSQRELLLLAGANMIGIIVTAFILPRHSVELAAIIGAGVTNILATGLTIVSMHQRDMIEKARQAELHRSREHLQIAMQAANMGAWDWDIPTGKIYWSDDVERLFGLKRGEFAGTFDAYMKFLPEDERRKIQRVINNTIESGRSDYHVIHSMHPREDRIIWLEGRGVVERDADKRPLRITGTVMDITARIEAEEERGVLLGSMQKRNAHLNTAARVSKSCNSILDPAQLIEQSVTLIAEGFDLYYVGLFLLKDQTAMLQAGYGSAGRRLLEEGFSLPLDEKSMVGWSIQHRKARIAQHVIDDEVRHHNPYLPETRSEATIPLLSRDQVIGALTFQSRVENAFSESDVSILQAMCDQLATSIENARLFSNLQVELDQRKKIEQERETLIHELEAKNAELERFTYTVSHDLKSPLITIRGFLGHLLDDARRGELARMQDDAKRISDATNRMQRLLDELLELSRVGRLVNPPESLSMEHVIHEALAIVDGRIQKGRIRVTVEPNLPRVNADRVRLVEAIQNLLDNAAKFMGDQPDPSIEIGARHEDGQVVFFIKDNGIGVDPKFHSKIFGLFDKLTPTSEGTGVGLALVKRIIEVHGGRIWIQSEAGQGATFYFTLPILNEDN